MFKNKYFKYKTKYLNLMRQSGGTDPPDTSQGLETKAPGKSLSANSNPWTPPVVQTQVQAQVQTQAQVQAQVQAQAHAHAQAQAQVQARAQADNKKQLPRVIGKALTMWMPHAKRALATALQGDIQLTHQPSPDPNIITIDVEAIGSGESIVRQLKVNINSTVNDLKKQIFENSHNPSIKHFQSYRLFNGPNDLADPFMQIHQCDPSINDNTVIAVSVDLEKDKIIDEIYKHLSERPTLPILDRQYANMRDDTDIVMIVVTRKGMELGYASRRLSENEHIVMAAATQNGDVLRFVSRELRNNQKIVMAAVTQNGRALEFASSKLRNDPEIATAAVTQDSRMLAEVIMVSDYDSDLITDAIITSAIKSANRSGPLHALFLLRDLQSMAHDARYKLRLRHVKHLLEDIDIHDDKYQ